MAVTHDAASSAYGTGVVSSLSWTHTPTGTPTGVGIGVAWWDGTNSISSVTYGGTACSLVVSAIDTGNQRSSLYGLANPASGAKTVTVTWSTGVVPGAGAETVTGGDTTTLTSNSASATGSSNSPSVACTSATDELVMDEMVTAYGAGNTPGTGQTERWDALHYGGNMASAGSTEAGASSVTMSWTTGGSGAWAIAAMSFKAAAGAAGIAIPVLTRQYRQRWAA